MSDLPFQDGNGRVGRLIMKDNKNPFALDFDTYILQSEPSKQEKGKLWQTAIGLQQVDGLTPSKYLYETAKRNIDGDITIEEAKQLIDSSLGRRMNLKTGMCI